MGRPKGTKDSKPRKRRGGEGEPMPMKRTVELHEDFYVHLPKSYFWIIVGVVGASLFLILSIIFLSMDIKPMIKEVGKILLANEHNELIWIQLSVICASGIIIEGLIAICTNRKKKFIDGLLAGLLIGLLYSLLYSLLAGLLIGLLGGLHIGLLAGLLVGLLAGLLGGEDD